MKLILFPPILFLLSGILFANEKLNFTVTSDSQTNNLKGNFEANGNVVIKSTNNNFEASANKLIFDIETKSLKLFGNVLVKNLEYEDSNIQMSSGDELTIFTETGIFEFKSINQNRVKTKIMF